MPVGCGVTLLRLRAVFGSEPELAQASSWILRFRSLDSRLKTILSAIPLHRLMLWVASVIRTEEKAWKTSV